VELKGREIVHLRDVYPFCIVKRDLRMIWSTLLLYPRLKRTMMKHMAQHGGENKSIIFGSGSVVVRIRYVLRKKV